MSAGWDSTGLTMARAAMRSAGVDELAVEVFAHYYRLLERGETGMIAEASIEPLQMESLAGVDVSDDSAAEAIRSTAIIKLNGGLGTSMGMARAKSLLCVRSGLSFLDIIARQVLHLRKQYDAQLPVMFMNSFRTSADTMAALARYAQLPVDGLPLEFLQNKEPKLLVDSLQPVRYPREPDLEWCPPGHGDLYTVLSSSGLIDQLIDQGYQRVFVSNADNLGATPDPRIAGWLAATGTPFAIEAVRRTLSDRKGGHFAKRKSDGRIVLRESAQTPPEDQVALADLDRHQFCSTNNLWFDLGAMQRVLADREGVLGLPLIRNVKPVDPARPKTPMVVQIETAMGAAIEIFEGARTIEVGRDRFVPVKTTNDLLVLRSDIYRLGADYSLDLTAPLVPFVDLDKKFYAVVTEFDRRFGQGAPSMKEATSVRVMGDWTFEPGVRMIGDVVLSSTKAAQRVRAGEVLGAVPDEPTASPHA
ncbi:MAG: UTP--glucose-1-phosphate uridylyltransferase [Nocardioides sp.]